MFCFVKFYCHHYKIHWFQLISSERNYLFRLVGRPAGGSAFSVVEAAADSDDFALDCFGDLSSGLDASSPDSPSLDASAPLTKVRFDF